MGKPIHIIGTYLSICDKSDKSPTTRKRSYCQSLPRQLKKSFSRYCIIEPLIVFVKFCFVFQIQRLVLVPTLLRSILMYLSLTPSERPLQDLKLWVCSGETLGKDLAAQFFQYFTDQNGYKLANFYGSTEVMGDVTYFVLEKAAQLEMFPSIPIGKLFSITSRILFSESKRTSI